MGRLVQLLRRSVLNQVKQVVVEHIIGAGEPVLGVRVDTQDLTRHADGLRSLTGKEQRVFVVRQRRMFAAWRFIRDFLRLDQRFHLGSCPHLTFGKVCYVYG